MATQTIRPQGNGRLKALLLAVVLGSLLTGMILALLPTGAESAVQVGTGTYTGNGTDDRAISGLGFQPDLVIIGTEASSATTVRTSVMPGDVSKPLGDTGTLQPNLVQSLNGDGFTLGSDSRVNANTVTYHWVAMQAGSGLSVGSYVGNSTPNRSITGTGFQPAWVMTLADGSDSFFRPSSLAGGNSFRATGFVSVQNRIRDIQPDGFVVGGDAEVNLTGRTYYYVAWGPGSDTAQGTYVGNGVDNRDLSIGLQPVFLWIKRDDGSRTAWRTASVSGDKTLTLDASAPAPNNIQSLLGTGFQLGSNAIVNGSGTTYHYLAIGGAPPPSTPTPTATSTPTPGAPPESQIASGTYTGNDSDDRAISGLGFQPDLVIIGTEASSATTVRTSVMPGDVSKPLGDTGTLQPNLVQSLNGDGFTLGSDSRVNANTVTYHWVAMQAGSGLSVGSYVGNSTPNRSITGTGFQPAWVMTLADGSDSFFRPSSLAGGNSFRATGFVSVQNRIRDIQPDGFVVGGDAEVNLTGRTYYYVAWGPGSDTAQGTYVGNGVDNRDLSIGLQPAFLWIKRDDGGQAAWRSASVLGDKTLTLDASAPAVNRIQSLLGTGFQLGSNAIVNGSGTTYHYLAIGSDAGPPPTDTPTPTVTNTPTPLPGSVQVPVFTNQTAFAGITSDSGAPYSWGVSWADYNNDFWPDAFYGRHAGLKSSLYNNNGNGTFNDIAPTAGIQKKLDRHACTWADYDADGFIDVMCTGGFPGPRTIVLYHNNAGNGTFTDVAIQAGLTQTAIPATLAGRAITWADFDADGHLDFFHNGEFKENVLARNLGNGTFANIAVQPLKNFANTMMESNSSADYDNDNRWDVFNCSVRAPRDDVQRTYLYRNLGNNVWQSRAILAGIIVDSCHSASWGDYDNDGFMDLFIGGRITPYLTETEIPETIIPNRLYRNLGNGTFQDVSIAAGILPTQAHMGTWGDFNNDGWQDLYVVNAVGLNDPPQPHKLYINNKNGTFSEVAVLAGVSDHGGGSGDGAAWADYNRDGFLDILLGNGGGTVNCDSTPNCKGPPRLFRNTPNGNHWLQIHLRATGNPFGYGSKVQLTDNGLTQYRQVTDGVAGMSQNYQMVQFGLGDQTAVDTIVIRWPDGTQTTLNGVQADQELLVTQGGGVEVLTH